MSKVKRYPLIILLILICVGIAFAVIFSRAKPTGKQPPSKETKQETEIRGKSVAGVIKLPSPRYESETPIEKALLERRSIRDYRDEPLTLSEISQLLWAAQGITDRERNYRTAPSAGALYPLEVYVVAGNVRDLADGIYKYKPQGHELVRVAEGDKRSNLSAVALTQPAIKMAAIDLVLGAVYERTTGKYGERGTRYVHMETGHAAQNIYLQAVSLNLGIVTIGAFDDGRVREILNMAAGEQPLYIIPVGRK